MDYREINKTREQFNSGQWPKFLEMVEIEGLRGFTGQAINFKFPIVAIVGVQGNLALLSAFLTHSCSYFLQINLSKY